MTVHRCPLPARPAPGNVRAWRCPDCQTRYVWSKRMIGREMREGWQRTVDDFETRRLRNEAEFNRSSRRALVIGGAIAAVVFVVIVALVLWIVLRVT